MEGAQLGFNDSGDPLNNIYLGMGVVASGRVAHKGAHLLGGRNFRMGSIDGPALKLALHGGRAHRHHGSLGLGDFSPGGRVRPIKALGRWLVGMPEVLIVGRIAGRGVGVVVEREGVGPGIGPLHFRHRVLGVGISRFEIGIALVPAGVALSVPDRIVLAEPVTVLAEPGIVVVIPLVGPSVHQNIIKLITFIYHPSIYQESQKKSFFS